MTVVDPGILDAHQIVIDWNDGEALPTVVNLWAGTSSVIGSHTYADDHPTGTPFDIYPIAGGVTDDDGGVGSGESAVQVNNVAPTLGAIGAPATPQMIGTAVSISAPYADPGTEDTFTCTVDWGDMTTSAGAAAGGAGGIVVHNR